MLTRKVIYKNVARDAASALYSLLIDLYETLGHPHGEAEELAAEEAAARSGLTREEFDDLLSQDE